MPPLVIRDVTLPATAVLHQRGSAAESRHADESDELQPFLSGSDDQLDRHVRRPMAGSLLLANRTTHRDSVLAALSLNGRLPAQGYNDGSGARRSASVNRGSHRSTSP
jgi:hypothetical protein